MIPDALNLANVTIIRSPTDIASWPITVAITGLTMTPDGGLTFTFDRAIPESWKWPSNPANPADHFQYTVWAVIRDGGVWMAAGFVQMWQGRPMGTRALPPILSNYVNWWGDIRHPWGPMSNYRPGVGDPVGFFISAGNARLTEGVTSVRERSNVVAVQLPANDSGAFDFTAPVPNGVPPLEPPPAPMSDDALIALIQQIANDVDTIKAVQAKGLVGQIARYLGTVALKPPT